MGGGEIPSLSGEIVRDGQSLVGGAPIRQSGEKPAGHAPCVYRKDVRTDGRLGTRNIQIHYMEVQFSRVLTFINFIKFYEEDYFHFSFDPVFFRGTFSESCILLQSVRNSLGGPLYL